MFVTVVWLVLWKKRPAGHFLLLKGNKRDDEDDNYTLLNAKRRTRVRRESILFLFFIFYFFTVAFGFFPRFRKPCSLASLFHFEDRYWLFYLCLGRYFFSPYCEHGARASRH